jgi:hypothetical protein
MKVVRGACSDARIAGKLCELILILLHHQSLLANKILAEGP